MFSSERLGTSGFVIKVPNYDTSDLLMRALYIIFAVQKQTDKKMSCILHIETSADIVSVALSDRGAILTEEETDQPLRAATDAAPMAERMMSFADSHAIPLDAIAVSSGPGSYTGLRIGASLAKGLAFGRNLELVAVPTLELLCVPVLLGEELPEDALLCPMLDARRMEVYAAIYDRALKPLRGVQPDIIAEDSYAEFMDRPLYFFGPGARKCRPMLEPRGARFLNDVRPVARWMMPLAEMRLLRGQTEDVAYFEPNYLKEANAGSTKKQ